MFILRQARGKWALGQTVLLGRYLGTGHLLFLVHLQRKHRFGEVAYSSLFGW